MSINRAEYMMSSVHYRGGGGCGGGQCAKSLISEYETKSQIETVCWLVLVCCPL